MEDKVYKHSDEFRAKRRQYIKQKKENDPLYYEKSRIYNLRYRRKKGQKPAIRYSSSDEKRLYYNFLKRQKTLENPGWRRKYYKPKTKERKELINNKCRERYKTDIEYRRKVLKSCNESYAKRRESILAKYKSLHPNSRKILNHKLLSEAEIKLLRRNYGISWRRRLPDKYILTVLGLNGLNNIPHGLIEAKKAHLSLLRLIKAEK